MHSRLLLGALITTVFAIPSGNLSPGRPILNCIERPTPPPKECREAFASLPNDNPTADRDGLHRFVKPGPNVQSPVDFKYTLPFSPVRHTCKIKVDLDVPEDHKGAYIEDRFSWRMIQVEARKVLDTCIDQMGTEGFVYNLGMHGLLRISITHIRFHSGTPGNLTLPSGPEPPLSTDTSATS